jgi:hypothetical protein
MAEMALLVLPVHLEVQVLLVRKVLPVLWDQLVQPEVAGVVVE